MMGMFANRANARWAEGEHWDAPHIYDVGKFSVAANGGQAGAFKQEILAFLRAGRFAVQVRGVARSGWGGGSGGANCMGRQLRTWVFWAVTPCVRSL